jgi:hypothetical protein
MKIVGMLTDNRHIRAKKDGYFTKENLLKQLDHFQPHFMSPNSNSHQVSSTQTSVNVMITNFGGGVRCENKEFEIGKKFVLLPTTD